MKMAFYWATAGLLAVTATAARAADDVLVPGDPPLTRAMADRKIDYWEWVFDLRLDDRQRADLRQLQVDEWGRRDKEWKNRWVNFLPAWRDGLVAGKVDLARVRAANRIAALYDLARGEGDASGRWLVARYVVPATPEITAAAKNRDAEAFRMAMLKLRHDDRMRTLQIMSELQAEHHALMMEIARNMAPSKPNDR